MGEVTVQSLSTKFQVINKDYPYTVPDWLKITLTITSTIIAIMVVVVLIYAKKSSNCLSGKHLWNNKKNKNTDLNEYELREINKVHTFQYLIP